MTSFRFIHTADIHLDSPLVGLAGYEGPAIECIRAATRQALNNLVNEAIDQKVDFVVVAGDLYDGDWRDYQTGLFFTRQMGRLVEVSIPTFVLRGNHDAESQITRHLALPAGVKVFSARKPQTFMLDNLHVALHGQSFRERTVTDNLASAYPEPVKGAFNIGVLHTALGGVNGHANYAPCGLQDLVAKGYDYWALGHVHQGVILNQSPHIVFPGNLQGRHIRETGPKGAYLVSVEDSEVTDLEFLQVDVVRWEHLKVDVKDCSQVTVVVDRIQHAIEEAIRGGARGRMLACRIELIGSTELHGQLLVSGDQWLAEARNAAVGFGHAAAWVERVVVSTQPKISAAALAAREDALGELHRMLDEAAGDEDLLRELEVNFGDFARKLPPDLRGAPEDAALRAAIQSDYPALIAEVRGYLGARLSAPED